MIELIAGDYSMRRPPMAVNVRALDSMEAVGTIKHGEDEYALKNVNMVLSLGKSGQIASETHYYPGTNYPSSYTMRKNMRDNIGTLFARENKKLHFEVPVVYEMETEVKEFLKRRVVKHAYHAFLTAVVDYLFDLLIEVRIKGDIITFVYTPFPVVAKGELPPPPPPGKEIPPPPPSPETRIKFSFQTPEVREFAKDLYDWAERHSIRLPRLMDEDMDHQQIEELEKKIVEEAEKVNVEEEIAKLEKLKTSGILSDDEFQASKVRLLKEYGGSQVEAKELQQFLSGDKVEKKEEEAEPKKEELKGLQHFLETVPEREEEKKKEEKKEEKRMTETPPPPVPLPPQEPKVPQKPVGMPPPPAAPQPPAPPPAPPQAPPTPAPPATTPPQKKCPSCGGPTNYIAKSKKCYCPKCKSFM